MTDYKKMYEIMVGASEKALRILVEAQQQCEEIVISSEEPAPILWLNREQEE